MRSHRFLLSAHRNQALDRTSDLRHAGRVRERLTLLPVPVRFIVRADSLEEARDKVRQLIEHGKAVHNGDIQWEWTVGS